MGNYWKTKENPTSSLVVAVTGVIKLALEAGKATPAPPVGPTLVPMVSMLWLSIRITMLGLPTRLAMLFLLELQSTMWVSHFFFPSIPVNFDKMSGF